MPARLGKHGEQGFELIGQGRRQHRAGQDPEAGASFQALHVQVLAEGVDEVVPGADPAGIRHRRGAIGVVEVEDAGLGDGVAGPEAGGMLRIALDLRGATQVALDQDPRRRPGERDGAGVVERAAGDEFLRLAHVREDLFSRLNRAVLQPAEGERGCRQLQEVPPADRVGPRGYLFGEFALHELLELRRRRQLVEAAPVLLAAAVRQARAQLRELEGRTRH